MKKFKRKEKDVEAVQWKKPGDYDTSKEVLNDPGSSVSWSYMDDTCGACGKKGAEHAWVDTIEGGHILCPGSWIIEKDNVVYVRSDEQFKKDYEVI